MSQWYQIENETFIVQLTTLGAEMKRLFSRKWNKELLWDADESVWARSAPHLFPIVGKLKDDEYELNTKTYKMTQHGFARDMEFVCTQHSTSEVTFALKASQESFKTYPYCFILYVKYKLEGQKLSVSYEVVNDDRQDIYFSLGAHPAFVTHKFSDYKIQFSEHENDFYRLQKGLVDWTNPSILNEKVINLTPELFSEDALIFKKTKSKYVDLINLNDDEVIRMHFDSPYFGIWSKSDIPFICLEPWSGVSDGENHNKDFTKKIGINKLPMGKSFHFSYEIELLDYIKNQESED